MARILIAWTVAAGGITSAEPLTNVLQVRSLTADQASHAMPVQIKGVMLGDMLQRSQSIVLADESGEIFITEKQNRRGLFTKFHRGDLLEIKAVTDAGGFAPMLFADSVRKLGTQSIPPAQPVKYQQLMTGSLDGQWVEFDGVVRQFFGRWTNSDIMRIVVSLDGGRVPVRFAESSHPGGIAVDSEVHVRAICFSQYNANRQIMNPVLQVPQGEPIIVEASPPDDPYSLPMREASGLRTFVPENLRAYAHRVHVRGIVTAREAGSFVWIRDGSTGLRIQTRQHEVELEPGEEIDVLGFLAIGSYPPALEDAVFRKIRSVKPPEPIAITNFNRAFDFQNDLVTMTAMLTRIQTVGNGVSLTLDCDNQSFEALLKEPFLSPSADWQTGSRVRVTGICSSVYDDPRPYEGIWQPKSFQLLMRSPADLTILTKPSWWTPKHTSYVLGIALAASLLVVAIGVAVSRRRLAEQAHRREMAEAEFAAILTERNRVAREIHDTLAQGLAATSVQLRLAKRHSSQTPELLAHHLDAAQQSVRDSLEEARNSIWNMRSQVLETGDLADALRGILGQMADGTELKTAFDVSGRVRRFAPVTENNLLRVGQEAITNAVRHARAKQIKVAIDFGEKQFRLVVSDNGRGFDSAEPHIGSGGFGLVGMRERAQELKGELEIRSARDTGTEVQLTVPLSSET